jgi:uncharacterized protein (DUF1697 family)
MPKPNYVAFLRGINVGKRQVQMTKLKSAFEKMGYEDVSTILATGNVVFSSDEEDMHELTRRIEYDLEKIFGFPIKIIIRSSSQIKRLLNSDPFKGIKVNADTRLYVTYLSETHESSLTTPYISKDKEYSIIKVTPTEVMSVLQLSPETRTVEAMAIIEKEFGKHVTTRNWNTVLRVAAATA